MQPSLANLAKERGIDLVPIDIACPLSEQGPFDCVLHKLYGDDWKANLIDYAVKNPLVPIIDQPDAIERLHNRISMLQVVSELGISQEKETFGIPKQVVVYDSIALSDSGEVGSLRFPVIAKPVVANGSVESHTMSLVYRHEGLLKLKPPLVLQEFVNHGGVIFKVYVVGDYVKCVKRRSLPDVSSETLNCSEGSLSFSHVSNMTMPDGTPEKYYENMYLEETEMPPMSFVTNIAMGLKRAMRLHLFNFDVIRDSKAVNHYLVIDINYFPGYAKLPSYEMVLTDFFWSIVHKSKTVDDIEDSAVGGDKDDKLLIGSHYDGTYKIEKKL
ncbi:hypothetical protein IEQ34_013952 [Dendrobium chrysotoxum]|uniref:Inositol-tetrakisphosphate 1-kinase n=1 Tax=Dendrobium chrysotoxum TaxID=161865 RepID=A0AAV7G1R4_DENCH|nr:hypothetical protein IEQ34_013952 [Dendrobium chrysotoxum]